MIERYKLTNELRKSLGRIGMDYSKGYYDGRYYDGRMKDTDCVTQVWPVRDEMCVPLTFRETENGLECINTDLKPSMALLMAVTASLEYAGGNFDD